MSRNMLIGTVALAGFAVLNIALSCASAAIWRLWLVDRTQGPSRDRARRLMLLRAVPAGAALVVTVGVILPAFAIFEPRRGGETAGPVLLALAAFGIAQLTVAMCIAGTTTVRTQLAARRWLRQATPLPNTLNAGVPAYAIDSLAPIVALVGVFQPKLVAARSVIDACTAEEFAAIVAHERGHLHARDNLKRWLLACTPDALRWTPVHREIAAAWDAAAEDAADDAATTTDASRVSLAALLIKVARLGAQPQWPAAAISPFVQPSGLDRRVRRLLAGPSGSGDPIGRLPRLMAAASAAALVAIMLRPQMLERLHAGIEAVVAFGR